jgi:transcriptional regulator with XRE-family HTH domain
MKERIEQILEDKGITQAEFANRVGISPATITHFFNGRNNLSEAVISKILLAYPEINPIWLLDGKGEAYQKVNDNRSLFDEEPTKEEKQLFPPAQFNAENVDEPIDIQREKHINPQVISPVESPIVQLAESAPSIAQSAGVQKQIRKIVFFYIDKTFEEYYPE